MGKRGGGGLPRRFHGTSKAELLLRRRSKVPNAQTTRCRRVFWRYFSIGGKGAPSRGAGGRSGRERRGKERSADAQGNVCPRQVKEVKEVALRGSKRSGWRDSERRAYACVCLCLLFSRCGAGDG